MLTQENFKTMVFYKGNRITGKQSITIPQMVADYYNANASFFASIDFNGSFLQFINKYGTHREFTQEEWIEVQLARLEYAAENEFKS